MRNLTAVSESAGLALSAISRLISRRISSPRDTYLRLTTRIFRQDNTYTAVIADILLSSPRAKAPLCQSSRGFNTPPASACSAADTSHARKPGRAAKPYVFRVGRPLCAASTSPISSSAKSEPPPLRGRHAVGKLLTRPIEAELILKYHPLPLLRT